MLPHSDAVSTLRAVNIARDSYASYVGHRPMVEYFAIAQNESIGRVRYEMLQKMLLP